MTFHELHVVFGATGNVGAAVVRELVAQGKRVRAVSRRGAKGLPANVEAASADVLNAEQAREAARGAAVVYNCTNATYTKWPELFPPMWRNVTAAASAAGAKLVVADNVYMYGPRDEPLVETMDYRATGRKGRTRIAMSEELMVAHTSGQVRVAVGRAADFYGPGVTLSFFNDAAFRKALAGQRVTGYANIDLPHSQGFIDDVARGLVALGAHDKALGAVWHLPHAPAVTQREFIQTMFEEAGQPQRFTVLPGWLPRLASPFVPMMREVAEMLYQYERPFVIDSSKFERAFGFGATPVREAISRTFDWVRSHQPIAAHS